MPPLLLLALVLFIIGLGALIITARQSKVAAGLLAAVCGLLCAFSIFGFLASFEPLDAGTALTAKLTYATLFVTGIAGIFWSARKLLLRSNRARANTKG